MTAIELQHAIARFESSGRQVQVQESFRFEPRRPRREVAPALKKRYSKPKSENAYFDQVAERMEYVSSIRELVKTMTIAQAMKATGRSESAMRRAAFEGDFKFQSKTADSERDLKLIERLTALCEIGLSRCKACVQVGISTTMLSRLELDYDFTCPKRWTKRT
ncbi:hypothetical protein QF019_000336 [Pseudomonas frederiksbergensis]|uniref:hypothetical protein n=1 Tax=Pseudomonas frederiksbergensis TaxID=104087 RepID=UPI003D21878F